MRHQTLYLLIMNMLISVHCRPPEMEATLCDYEEYERSLASRPDAGVLAGEPAEESQRDEHRDGCVPSPPNLLRNGAFEYQPTHACGWDTFDAANWGIVAAPYCVANDHPSCSVYLASEVWGDHWVTQFYQRVVLEPGVPHAFTFEAKAAGVARPLLVSILGGGPLRNKDHDLDLGAGIELELPTEWHSYAFSFIATEYAENSIVDFALGGADTGLYLDNVTLMVAPPPEVSPDARVVP